tara:strand:- start:209 stop:1270 length:1062 start_codon:yes stop_codon:yes gene_type:complete
MSNLTSAQRAEIRKHALKAGKATAGWSDSDFRAYDRSATTLTERDLTPRALPVQTAKAAPAAHRSDIEQAISDLILASANKTPSELDEARVVELVKEHSVPQLISVKVVKADQAKVMEGVHKMFPVVLAHISAGVNTAIVGPAGSGKSTMFEQIAEALELDYYFQGAVQQEHKIMGHQDANGVYHRTAFRDCYENGGLFVFEEFDGSHPRAMLSANNAVAGGWCDFPDGKIKKHEKFVCVMAGNTYGTGASREYVGRNQLDAATLDRFAFIEVGYDEALELAAAVAFWADAASWVGEVQAFRKKVEKASLRHVVSPRASIMGAKLMAAGVDRADCIKSLLHKGLSADQLAQVA